ncbi:oligosaccharide flippase family protein [Roseovarius salinarum]|uniref:oligosaccharide flippase family protein n=1 Tax=Roseovarius salinarum TaxID=1981892 RepID=UPI000C32FE64|nr:oligosaccharide flippase family protein [Roseovarius salinarum]
MRVINAFRGTQLTARILRSTSWVIVGFGGSQAIRLGSNLILTRILFPEAFGLMALVTMVNVGLMMFSDVGLGPSVARSQRGDEPEFLDTAWTVQVIRGIGLWAVTLVLASPMAALYDEPDLALYLPVAGLSLIATGLLPMRVLTARRHLLIGRMTVLDLTGQLIGLGAMVALALATRSVFALVVGGVITNVVTLILMSAFLSGHRNRFRMEPAALHELIHFGKWIFLSTACTFVSTQGDKAVLGKMLTLEALGIYNIGYFLAYFPMQIGLSLANFLLIPIFRERPPGESAANREKLRKMRFLLSAGMCGLLAVMALAGPPIVAFLYDDRYLDAGAIMVVLACGFVPQAIGISYSRAALAAGDSRGNFVVSGTRAVLQMTLLIAGLQTFGLIGGLASIGVTMLVVHPILIRLARRHAAWDPLHDAVFFAAGGSLAAVAIWLHWAEIAELATIPMR